MPVVRKCDGCFERQKAGKVNACVEACPAEASVAGTREELLAEAKKRIAENPGTYHPEIYGEHEVGGTNVLVLSPVPFDAARDEGRPRHAAAAEPHLGRALEDPQGRRGRRVGLSAIYWITHRRDEVAAAERPRRSDDHATRRTFPPGLLDLLLRRSILAAAAVVTVLRFWKGLGAVTNLSDRFPWGLWVGFDVLCGVGLAAGGFTITTAVYVFNLKRFKPIVRPTIITAFLGYILVAVGLMFDLGKPWNIWHPLVMWNPHSPMFEVSWCVMLYLTVLALEFSGMVFERLGWTRAVAVQHAAIVPLVIAGAVISTLHQSSLGTFYLIMPGEAPPALVLAPGCP